eukprot:4757407-Pyramimonas_sp.AAC.1
MFHVAPRARGTVQRADRPAPVGHDAHPLDQAAVERGMGLQKVPHPHLGCGARRPRPHPRSPL